MPTKNKKNIGHILEGETTNEVLQKVWSTIQDHGTSYQGQRGIVRSIKGVTLIINNPLDEKEAYPYWDEESDSWYQNNFVRKETNKTPETITEFEDIYPYKYVERSRYYDAGIGNVLGTVRLLKKLDISSLNIRGKKDLELLIRSSYEMYHPERLLSVLHWQGKEMINFYLQNIHILEKQLERNRRDTLLSVIEEIRSSPASRRAIMPSFTYEHIDHSGAAGGVPVYQNYQLYVEFHENGKIRGLISLHLHRAFDAYGGAQLDISHDREWGKLASEMLGMPLLKMVIYGNDIWEQMPDKSSSQHLQKKTDIRNWLFSVTDGYDPKNEDIEKRLASHIYKSKMEGVIKNFNR